MRVVAPCLLFVHAASSGDIRALRRFETRAILAGARIEALERDLEFERQGFDALLERLENARAAMDPTGPGPPGPRFRPTSMNVPATDAHPHRQLTSPPAAVIDLDTQGTLSAFSSPSGTGGVLEISAASKITLDSSVELTGGLTLGPPGVSGDGSGLTGVQKPQTSACASNASLQSIAPDGTPTCVEHGLGPPGPPGDDGSDGTAGPPGPPGPGGPTGSCSSGQCAGAPITAPTPSQPPP